MGSLLLLSQNLKLDSLDKVASLLRDEEKITVLSTQFLFDNERAKIDSIFGIRCIYLTFADLLSDAEREKCDIDSFCPQKQHQDVNAYYRDIKILKNRRIAENLLKRDRFNNKIIVSDDLGIYKSVWIEFGFTYVECEYYYSTPKNNLNGLKSIIRQIAKLFLFPFFIIKDGYKRQISVAYKDGIKYLFYGSLNRIGYRLNLSFSPASKIENLKYIINRFGIVWPNNTVRLSSLHEGYHKIYDSPRLNVKLIQDGVLPPNYSSNYLYFYGRSTEFYTWDKIGCNTFIHHHLPHRIMPFRKKLYIPQPKFPKVVKKVLCVASGAGDWTAIKNRSDEDMMIVAFGKVAKAFPEIEFVYRCHPVWIHPMHQGVNSINRAIEYFEWLNLPNLKISSNIPNARQNGKFILSYKRTSFEDDLKDVDIVFGEHSIAMVDAAFKGILFCSCNVTGHRNFFEDITKLGFPHCRSVEDIITIINELNTTAFQQSYDKAICNYNRMTDLEE